MKDVRVDPGTEACTKTDTLTCVSVTLALDPDVRRYIPKNVSAQILPKTLFGEQYVSLTLPSDPEGSIKSGDKIAQDRSEGALETQKVLGDLLPLLKAVQPAELNATLTALATALDGRGEKLGQTLVGLDKYLKSFNPHTSALVADLKRLGQVSLEYNSVDAGRHGHAEQPADHGEDGAREEAAARQPAHLGHQHLDDREELPGRQRAAI